LTFVDVVWCCCPLTFVDDVDIDVPDPLPSSKRELKTCEPCVPGNPNELIPPDVLANDPALAYPFVGNGNMGWRKL
jgi:hypothetical protein